ncbi:Spo11/DNA topoisomerase VI subunit A [Apiospora saccharicola]|uniref:DNA topoisomerase (ATP-hydrolyzing) n=1 Tax=Apiospora saccharicola TaxID=335842 RepID=A0ABR1TLB6_9PEZI
MDRRRSNRIASSQASLLGHGRASSQTLSSEENQALFEDSPDGSVQLSNDQGVGRQSVVSRIEDIMESMVDSLSENQPMTLPLRSRQSGKDFAVSFPSTTQSGVKKFTALLQVFFLCHQALVSGTIITKRSIYYQNPELFESQRYVDELVDDIAFTFGVGRNELNIVAASKGLIAGQPFGPEHGDQAVAVPPAETVVDLDLRQIEWILVIEKEATFRSLVSLRYHEVSVAGRGILMTAKGYPDLASRQFVHRIHSECPQIPLYALIDFDPDGVSILRTYKHGSQSMRHEEHVTAPGLLWLGVKSSDLLELQMRLPPMVSSGFSNGRNSQSTLSSSQLDNDSESGRSLARSLPGSTRRGETGWKFLSMSCRDRTKAVQLLCSLNDQAHQDADEMELTSEVQLMLVLNMKFEIQAVDQAENMAYWLDERLSKISGWI